MSYSDVLASCALLVSLATAGWTAWRAWRWDRPVIEVTGEQWLGQRSTAPGQHIAGFSMEVVNTGNISTQVIAAFWQIDRGDGIDVRFTASHGGGGFESFFTPPDHASAPELPFPLDRYHRRAWDFEMSLEGIREQETIRRARPGVQYTSRRKTEYAYGDWQPSQIGMEAVRIAIDTDPHRGGSN
ncbi:hypothetical protein [Cryobacterium sp. N22]|uniref:hypothetical protein n=1 Tax=Cryobacterium sp. N22 TaxID=2048290 RepID=UPI0011B088DB|nr:hypothetical protein [Cryobacterium sp. N22]